MNCIIASPEEYRVPQETFENAFDLSRQTGARLQQISDPQKAIEEANVVYTDTWFSMGQEDEEDGRIDVFTPYQVNQEILSFADPSVIVMHCLPAHRGQEITDEVADAPNSMIFQQAENRMHAQKAILVHLLAADS
jgi:ornithine carbamoyltransferase